MPDRVVRDEILRSHRYRTLSSDTLRVLFVHLLLQADSLGNCEATTTALGDAMGRQVDEATAAKWLAELSDVDLVRVYTSDAKRYCHIPRFRQRLRYPNGKHPRPPAEMECKEIRELAQRVRPKADQSQPVVRPQSAEVKRSEVKRREENKGKVKTKDAESAAPLPPWLDSGLWERWYEHRRMLRHPMTPYLASGLIAKLARLKAEGHDPNKLLQQSIDERWRGIVEPTFKGTKHDKQQQRTATLDGLTGRSKASGDD